MMRKKLGARDSLNMKNFVGPRDAAGFYQLELDDHAKDLWPRTSSSLCKGPAYPDGVVMADGIEEERKPEHLRRKVTLRVEPPPKEYSKMNSCRCLIQRRSTRTRPTSCCGRVSWNRARMPVCEY